MVFALAQTESTGRSSIVMLLLTGLAMNALFMSGIGFMAYIARDPQARSITFWNLGTLSGADWTAVTIVGFATVAGTLAAFRYAKQLNALMIGEEEATYLGVNVNRLKWIILSINVVIVAVATAFTGVIGFVGLIVPHILRMLKGADNRFLIIGSALMGGTLLEPARISSRDCRSVPPSCRSASSRPSSACRCSSRCCGGASTCSNRMLEAIDVTYRAGGRALVIAALGHVRARTAAPRHRTERRGQVHVRQGAVAAAAAGARARAVRGRRRGVVARERSGEAARRAVAGGRAGVPAHGARGRDDGALPALPRPAVARWTRRSATR